MAPRRQPLHLLHLGESLLKPDPWSYRVRGIDLSLATGAAQMTWSDKLSIVIAKPKFKVGR